MRRTPLIALAALALAACADEGWEGAPPGEPAPPIEGEDFGEPPWAEPEEPVLCAHAYTIDGRFTLWPSCEEWRVSSAGGIYSTIYVDYAGDRLYVMADWTVREAPVPPHGFARFRVVTEAGQYRWDVKVFGDNSVNVIRNAQDLGDQLATGGVGHIGSPHEVKRHAVFELGLTVGVGDFCLTVEGPAPLIAGEDEMIEEPKRFCGRLSPDGAEVGQTDDATLFSVMPPDGEPGDAVDLIGVAFGTSWGEARFDGQSAQLLKWTPELVRAVIPANAAGPTKVRVQPASGAASNAVTYWVSCDKDCTNKECGDNGCGGLCGLCPEGSECTKVGLCTL